MINKIFYKIKTDRFYFDSIVLIFFTVLGNLFAFLVNIIYTRTLPPGQYGAIMSINSLINILGTVAIAFRMFNVRETSEFILENQTYKAISFSYKFSLYSFIAITIFFLSIFPVYSYLVFFINVDYLAILFALAIVIFSYITSITSSLFQSMKMFFALGIVTFIYPFVRFVFTYPYIILWNGYIGATASMLTGIVLSFVISSFIILHKEQNTINNNESPKFNLSYFLPLIPIVIINAFYSFLNFGDVIFSRKYFNEADTDIFAIASTIAKANLFVIAPISYVVLPRMIEDLHKKGYISSVKALFKGVFLALISSFFYTVFIYVFSDTILGIFGERYLNAKPILLLFTIAFIPIATSLLLINYGIVFKNWFFMLPLFISDLILILGFTFFHKTFEEMILVDLISGTFLFLTLVIMIFLSKEPKSKVSEEENTLPDYKSL
ncbi:MAG: hypothetical protein ACK4F9_06310 [Brevinematia bacterium]